MFLMIIFTCSCVTEYLPVIEEQKELLVVEGLINDQPGPDTIKLSKSVPFGKRTDAEPIGGCILNISDDLGNSYNLSEKRPGVYLTDSATFNGKIGRTYTLHIRTTDGRNYESIPMEMKPVPPIDSIYYEKTVIKEREGFFHSIDGCQIYLDTHDPSGNCKFFRWDYSETWEIRLPYFVTNRTCWISETSDTINIKSTAAFNEARIIRQPLTFITNITDRLKRKYSILVNQYSLNEDEYIYWEKIQNLTNNAGGLYDIVPSSVSGNIMSVENSSEKVLGYFSVSAKSSRRFFIKGNFEGIIDPYTNCITGTVFTPTPEGLGVSVWILEDHLDKPVPYWVITDKRGCADCTVRGTNKKPDFWIDN